MPTLRNRLPSAEHTKVIALAVIIGAGILYLWSQLAPHPLKCYFIDEVTGEVSVHPVTAVPPLANARGELTIVRATYFRSPDGTGRTLAYLRKNTPEANATVEAAPQGNLPAADPASEMVGVGYVIRLPAPGSPWVSPISAEGMRIIEEAQKANGGHMQECVP